MLIINFECTNAKDDRRLTSIMKGANRFVKYKEYVMAYQHLIAVILNDRLDRQKFKVNLHSECITTVIDSYTPITIQAAMHNHHRQTNESIPRYTCALPIRITFNEYIFNAIITVSITKHTRIYIDAETNVHQGDRKMIASVDTVNYKGVNAKDFERVIKQQCDLISFQCSRKSLKDTLSEYLTIYSIFQFGSL